MKPPPSFVHLPIRIHPVFARNLPQTVSVDLATLFFLHGFMNLDVFLLGTTHTLLNHKKTANYHLPEPVLWKCQWSSHAPHYLCSRKDQSPDGDHGSWITSPVALKVNSPRVFRESRVAYFWYRKLSKLAHLDGTVNMSKNWNISNN